MAKGTGDYTICVDEAKAFLEAAHWCAENTDRLISGLIYPFAVNIGFACELFLKAIMMHDSKTDEFVRGHDLEQLFNAIDNVHQKAIEKEYAKDGRKPLQEIIHKNAKLFEEWRYGFEKGVSVDVTDIETLAETLKAYVETLK